MGNYSQPDFRIPITDPKVEVRPHQVGARNGNPLGLDAAAIPDFVQPSTAAATGAEILKPIPSSQLVGGPMGISGSGPSGGK